MLSFYQRSFSLNTGKHKDSQLFKVLRSVHFLLDRTFIYPTHTPGHLYAPPVPQGSGNTLQDVNGKNAGAGQKEKGYEILPSGHDRHWKMFSQQQKLPTLGQHKTGLSIVSQLQGHTNHCEITGYL